jgi:hypothetical protein
MNPRPTMEELTRALYPLGFNLKADYKAQIWSVSRKYTRKEYRMKLEEQAQKRRDYMTEVKKARGIECIYDYERIVEEAR